jgi:hypothetical protein
MSKPPSIALSEPYPLMDPGVYVALCPSADFAWARQWQKWIARLEMQPENYTGRPYIGRLCKFLGLGKNKKQPYAGPQSHFRRLLVEANGEQPARLDTSMEVFIGLRYDIEVVTVTQDRDGNSVPLSTGTAWSVTFTFTTAASEPLNLPNLYPPTLQHRKH